MKIIGRQLEQQELQRIYESDKSEFLMVYGRRRVGKTFLIREYFKNNFDFYITGIAQGSKKEQLMNFRVALNQYDDTLVTSSLNNWFEAFDYLKQLLSHSKRERKIVFLDELPWIDTPKSDFIKALELFWNSWASARTDIKLIVCGSAASWMVKNIIKNHGGLHNRLTFKMKIQPFSLAESKIFLQQKGIFWEDMMLAECYMILGGIPYYMDMIEKGKSLAQNVDALFFSEAPLLEDEFSNLFASLFKKSSDYIRIVDILSHKKSGYTRDEIIQKSKLSNGGGLTRKLDELEECGFVRKYKTMGDVSFTYQLIDFFCLFYFSFIKKGQTFDTSNWQHLTGTPRHNTWCGLSFEHLCMSHLKQIKMALGISGISTSTYAFHNKNTQIDMVIDRGDNIVNICEMKYTDEPYSINKSTSENIKNKCYELKSHIKKRKGINVVLVTTYPIKQNEYSINMIQNNVVLNDLFKE